MRTQYLPFVIAVLGLSGPAWAAPSINDVAGVLSNGDLMTVTGTDFGTKDPAAPILWETFDGGTSGELLSTDSRWPSYNGPGNGTRYSDVSPHSGTLCVYNYVQEGDPNDQEFGTNNFHFSETDELYYSYLYRHEGTDVEPAVQKNGRINATGNLYNGPGVVALSDSYVYYHPGDAPVYPEDDNGTGRYFSGSLLGSSEWTRHQIYGRLSQPAGTANGLILVSVGAAQKTFANIVTRLSGESFRFSSIILGTMFANINEVPESHHDMYVDDVYIDDTRARVELCAGAAWEARGICNPQPATAWLDGSIDATVNTGEWLGAQTVYAYVVDSDGVANPTGYELVLSGSGSGGGGTGGAGAAAAGSGAGGSGDNAAADNDGDSGCGCRLKRRRPSSGLDALILVTVMVGALGRRRP